MRAGAARWRGARAALALLGGLVIGGGVGGGTLWLLNRDKINAKAEPGAMPGLALAKADEVAELVPADAIGFAHVRVADLWKTEAVAGLHKLVEKAGPEAIKTLDEGFVPAPSTIDRVTLVVT